MSLYSPDLDPNSAFARFTLQMIGFTFSHPPPPPLDFPSGVSSQTAEPSMPQSSMDTSLLMSLPTEILMQIVKECSLWSLVNLREVSCFFSRLCTPTVLYNKARNRPEDVMSLLFYAAMIKDKALTLKLLRTLGRIEIDFSRAAGGFRGPTRSALKRSTPENLLTYVLHSGPQLLLARRAGGECYTALAWAAEQHIVPFMRFIFRKDPTCVDNPSKEGRTPLHVAIKAGRERWAECLLTEYGADPNSHGTSALVMALVDPGMSNKFVGTLLANRAIPDFKSRSKGKWWTPLHAAAAYCDAEAVQMILDCGVDVDPMQGDWARSSTPLHLAALRKGGDEIVRTLLRAGANYLFENEMKKSVFACLEKSGNSAAADLLTILYQKKEPLPPGGRTYTHLAVQHGALELLRMCIRAEEGLEAEDDDGHSPLYTAIKFRQVDAAAMLAEAGVKEDYLMEKYGTSLLHFAATIPGLEFYRALLNKGSRLPFSTDRRGYTPISIAAWAMEHPGRGLKDWRLRDGEKEAGLLAKVSAKQRELCAEASAIGVRLGTIWDVGGDYTWDDEDVGMIGAAAELEGLVFD